MEETQILKILMNTSKVLLARLIVLEYHPVHIKYEVNDYELAKQDRDIQERDLVIGKSDLANLRKPERVVSQIDVPADNSIVEGG